MRSGTAWWLTSGTYTEWRFAVGRHRLQNHPSEWHHVESCSFGWHRMEDPSVDLVGGVRNYDIASPAAVNGTAWTINLWTGTARSPARPTGIFVPASGSQGRDDNWTYRSLPRPLQQEHHSAFQVERAGMFGTMTSHP